MRAILIDPEKRTVAEIQVGRGYKQVQAVLRCRSFTTGSRPLRGSLEDGFDAVYVSDDYLEDRDNPRFWFQVDADRDPPSSYPIAGLGLVQGVDKDGEECDATISLDEVRKRITFTQRKFRGFETFTGAAARARGADLVIEPRAPLVDGTEEDPK